ncbi:hypothetical protein BJV78DRAFT_1175964 [Lactifluus subvellereus]|nr:hypothetical protein BJV78DRAFT_1175964 [Lactifluus subvellereus]
MSVLATGTPSPSQTWPHYRPNVGFFHHGFTPKTCSHFYEVAPALKGTMLLLPAVSALQG